MSCYIQWLCFRLGVDSPSVCLVTKSKYLFLTEIIYINFFVEHPANKTNDFITEAFNILRTGFVNI